jgi:hypothetical protein
MDRICHFVCWQAEETSLRPACDHSFMNIVPRGIKLASGSGPQV